jgi:hypothetical protein
MSGAERFLMGVRMFDAARRVALASFRPIYQSPRRSGFFSNASMGCRYLSHPALLLDEKTHDFLRAEVYLSHYKSIQGSR